MTKPKQSHKKQKPDTGRKKTSTVPKGATASRVIIDAPEVRPKPYDTEFNKSRKQTNNGDIYV